MGAGARVNARDVVEQLWHDLRARREVEERTTVPELAVHEHLAHLEALRYLNVHWQGRSPSVRHPEGSTKLRKRAKDRLAAFVLDLFAGYLEEEREYRAQAVRVSNAFATGHDRIAHEIRAVAEAVRTESLRLTEEFGFQHRLLEERVAALEQLVGSSPP